MAFSELDKLKALAIVHIFETSKPFGDYSAVAVLDDGAGISYGINQFTHKSGSLAAVLERFLELGGEWSNAIHKSWASITNRRDIANVSADRNLKADLAGIGNNPLMQQAQREIAFELYLKPALDACEGSDFTLPLSLAVIYDSMNHGSWEKIRDRVQFALPASIKPEEFEKEWIHEYVQKRDAWLESVPRLRKTHYRTDFFIAQIARGNWHLDLPLNVHGFKLTDANFQNMAAEQPAIDPPINEPAGTPSPVQEPSVTAEPPLTPSVLEKIEKAGRVVESIGKPIDAAVEIGNAISRRADSAKSMWTTLVSVIYQTIWALIAFLIGLPKEVWLVVAIVVAAFGLYYLYRQITLGKIRESK